MTNVKVAIYARVSSEEQAERGTIENQIEFANKYCDLHEYEIVDYYKDEGVTGTIPLDERQEGKRLLDDAKKRKFDLVLVYKLDRLGRSARIILNSVYELEQYGIKIKSMTEPFDTSDPSGRFLLTILAGVADLERETILERLWHGANRAAREGKWVGGIVPYGYKVNDEGYLEINEDKIEGCNMSEADVIRLIYHLIAEQGYSTIKVADYLNALGIPPMYAKLGRQITRGKRKVNTSGIWRPGRIRNMVVNPIYKGIHYYGKRTKKQRELIAREVPAIVSEEIWEKAQQVLRENQICSAKNAKHQYLLKGLIKCALCGHAYIGFAAKRKYGEKLYYICNGKQSARVQYHPRCKAKSIPAEWIESLIWNECVEFINNPGHAIEELAATMEQKKNLKTQYEEEKLKIVNAILEKDNEKENILDLFRKKIISMSDVEKQLSKINEEKKVLEERLEEIDKKLLEEVSLMNRYNNVEELLNSLREKLKNADSFEVRREIIRILVKEIIMNTVEENNRPVAYVIVRYNFQSKVVTRTDKGSWHKQA